MTESLAPQNHPHPDPLPEYRERERRARSLTFPQLLLFALLFVTGSVDLWQAINVAGVSGLGMTTMLGCGLVLAVWLRHPVTPRHTLFPVFPLICLVVYATGSLLWSSPGKQALQLLSLWMLFLGLILLTARETARRPKLAAELNAFLIAAIAQGAIACVLVLLLIKTAKEPPVNPRSVALGAMIVIAAIIPRVLSGNRLLALWGIALVVLIFESLSRTALVVSVSLVPIALLLRSNRRSVMVAVISAAVAAGGFFVALNLSPALNERFFGHDASLKVGGVAINGEGRARMWTTVLDDLGNDWLFGKGVAGSEILVEQKYGKNGLAQPHNDYLRFYYDTGIVGLLLWLAFAWLVGQRMYRSQMIALRNHSPDASIHAGALVALIAVSLSMATDNDISYPFVMIPLGVLIGASLGTDRRARFSDARSVPR